MSDKVTVPQALNLIADHFMESAPLQKGRVNQDGCRSCAQALRDAAIYVAKLEAVAESVQKLQEQPITSHVHVDTVPNVKAIRPRRLGRGVESIDFGKVETIAVEDE